jgi:hypothetical protein
MGEGLLTSEEQGNFDVKDVGIGLSTGAYTCNFVRVERGGGGLELGTLTFNSLG